MTDHEKDARLPPLWKRRISDLSRLIQGVVGVGLVAGWISVYRELPGRLRATEESLAKINASLDQSKSEIKEGYYSAKISEERERAREEKLNDLKERIRECCPYRRFDRILDEAVGRRR